MLFALAGCADDDRDVDVENTTVEETATFDTTETDETTENESDSDYPSTRSLRPVVSGRTTVEACMKSMAVLLAAIALVGAGCGGDGDGDGDGAVTETTTVEDTTDGTVAEGTIGGSVGPGFEISITPTGPFEPGSYELTVEDLSSAHNFHLSGSNVDVSTSVGEEGTETFSVDLQPGTYEFVCDPHATSMRGSFEVG